MFMDVIQHPLNNLEAVAAACPLRVDLWNARRAPAQFEARSSVPVGHGFF
jgi:hypothetical protein